MSQQRKRKSSSPQPSCSKRKDTQAVVPITADPFMKAGTLAKIVVRNFMCHDMLSVCLNNGLNFLVGRNGSGKSAILTAVVVGLGAKASITNRGNSLKEFIKKGQNSCFIEITLNNIGLDAYKSDVFGDKIIVLRTITSSGTSSYKIKSASGVVVSNKRDELEKIVTALNIQVDNPVCVLNQDTARTFLNSSDPRDKFRMFVRATYLEYMQRSLDEALECVFRSRTILKKKTEAFQSMEKEMNELENKWNRVQGLQSHQERCAALEQQLPWAKVVEAEAEVQKASEELEGTQQATVKLKNEIETLTNQISEIQVAKGVLNQKLNDHQTQHDILEAQARRLRAQLQERKHELREKVQAMQVLDGKIMQHEQNATALRNLINDILARSQEQDELQKEHVSRERARMKEELVLLHGMRGTRQGDTKRLESRLLQLREQQTLLLGEKHTLVAIKAQYQQELLTFNNSKRTNLSVFGVWVPELVKKVDAAFKNKKFSVKPIGPLGAYIKSKDDSWNPAIESYLKPSMLTGFLCNTSEDCRVLNAIIDQLHSRSNFRPLIIISKFLNKMHNVSAHKVQHDTYSSLLDMLTIENPVVANCLIDNNRVESILLVPTDQEACALMERLENVPANCARVITKRGYEYLQHPYRSYGPSNKNLTARYLQVTTDQHERNLQIQRKEVIDKLNKVEAKLSVLTVEITTSKKNLDENLREVSTVSKKLRDVQAAIDQLSFEEPQTQSVEDLNREMAACLAEAEQLRMRREIVMEEQEPMKIAIAHLKEQLYETEQGWGQSQSTSNIKKELEKLEEQQRCLQSEQGHKVRNVRELDRKLLILEQKVQELQTDAREAVELAMSSGPRIATTKSVESLQQELDNCRRFIDGVTQELGDFDELNRSYHSYKEKYGKIRSTLNTLTGQLKDMEGRLKLRKDIHERAKRSFSAIINYGFMSLLNRADFKGRVKINYKEKTLTLEVEPPSNKGGFSIHRCTDSLSGGERSYSTVSFVMALWQIVHPPFYFLDEFDVFMDKVNRSTVLKLLQMHAEKNTSSQYVLLTPLDLTSINTSKVHVFKFDDPRP